MTEVRRPVESAAHRATVQPDDHPARYVLALEDRAESRTPGRFREAAIDRGGVLGAGERSLVTRR